jgi:hypothetical protein
MRLYGNRILDHDKLPVDPARPTTRRRQPRPESPCTTWGGVEATSASIVAGEIFVSPLACRPMQVSQGFSGSGEPLDAPDEPDAIRNLAAACWCLAGVQHIADYQGRQPCILG